MSKNSKNYWKPRPKAGDIVQCHFPEYVGRPGPKPRPALVLEVEEALDDPEGCVVVVAYATSQKIDRIYPEEVLIRPDDDNGLTKLTKLDLANRHRLEFTEVWFLAAFRTDPPHPRCGCINLDDAELMRDIGKASRAAKKKLKGKP